MALTMDEIKERNKRIESFDLVNIILNRCDLFQSNDNKIEIINMYNKLPQKSKININKLVRRIYFKSVDINDKTIYDLISNRYYISCIMKVIECETKYNELNGIVNDYENNFDLTPNYINLTITTCPNCSKKNKNIINRNKPLFCFTCGKYYQNGIETSLKDLKENSRTRK